MEKKPANMTPEEKQEERFKRWLSPAGINFVSPEAEKLYKERVTRIIDAIQLKKPDRVPVILNTGFFPAYYYGISPQEAMYDSRKACLAWQKYLRDFEPDAYASVMHAGPGKAYEKLDLKSYRWPGHGVPPDSTYQFVESEYMRPEEYDALIQDPSDFWLRTLLPRQFGALEGLRSLSPFTDIIERPKLSFLGRPEVQASLKALTEAGAEAYEWNKLVSNCDKEMLSWGFPAVTGGMTLTPFDAIGDTLRGTQGVMLDMYRRPDKLLEAMERLTPLLVRSGVSSADSSGVPLIFIPLHKGSEGFMSEKQYRTFYWHTLKKLAIRLIEEGVVPLLFAEGRYEARLEIISDLPRGKVIWQFDQTDIARAKKVLGNTACITGNVPSSILVTGTPQQVTDYCRKLIEDGGRDGGYILGNGAQIDRAKPDNIHAIIDAAKKYGVYK